MIKNKFFSIKRKKESRNESFTELSLNEDLTLLNKKRDSKYYFPNNSHSVNDWSGETNITPNEKNCSYHV
jgi:hypothetical protein